MASNETTLAHESIPVVRMESVSLLASNNGTTTINADPATTQFISFPLLSDVSMSGVDQQNIIFARSTDGNTIVLDASQLALLTDHAAIPVYDGTNLFQVTEATDDTSAVTVAKSIDIPSQAESTDIHEIENANQPPPSSPLPQPPPAPPPPPLQEDDILPPDRV